MGTYTTNLSLYNTDMNTDGNDTFDFQRDLNDNNDKIDSAIGKLSTLTTTDKSSLVNAIIEIVSSLGGKASKSLDDLNAVGQAVLDKKVEVEALLAQNGYAKFSWKENNEISNLIVCWGIDEPTGAYTTKDVTLPVTFTAGYLPVVISDHSTVSIGNVHSGAGYLSNSQFRIVHSSSFDCATNYLLMGY